MKELFFFSFSLVNIIPTALLLLIILYWITVLFGFFSTSSFDFDLDADADLDIDLDVDADVDFDAGVDTDIDVSHVSAGNFFIKSLKFFNIGKVPFMIFLSAFVIPFWLISINTNYYLNVEFLPISLVLAMPIGLVSMFIAKLITQPVAGIFKKMEDDTGKPDDFTGKIATVRISVDNKTDGQIEVNKDGSKIILSARTVQGEVPSGKTVLIIDYLKDEKYYIVEEFEDFN